MKNKVFYPYIIVVLLMFVLATFSSIKYFGVNAKIFELVALGAGIPFSLLVIGRNQKDKWLCVGFAAFAFTGELLFYLNQTVLGIIFSIVAFGIVFYRLLSENKKTLLFGLVGFVIIATGLYFVFNIFASYAYLLAVLASELIADFVLAVYTYNKGSNLHKPNWFFLAAGMGFFILYELCFITSPLIPITAGIRSMVDMSINTFFVPAYAMATVSFMLFEPRAS